MKVTYFLEGAIDIYINEHADSGGQQRPYQYILIKFVIPMY